MRGKGNASLRLLAGLTGAAVLLAAVPAYAVSPSFARSAQEWASLQDNKLEYGEIEALVTEYNPTVQQNQYEYNQFRKDYGDTKDDVSDEYRRLANELLNDIVYPDEDDANYASGMTAALTSEVQANNLLEQADNNLEDAEIRRLTYEMAEKSLAQTAQNNMISYHTGLLTIETDKLAKELAEINLSSVQAQASVGRATAVQVFTAKQSVQNAEKTLIDDTSSTETTKQKLQIMLGWKADSAPEIGDLPEPDLTRIDSMNPEADLGKALETNYTLRINKKKLSNATDETDYKTLQSTISDNESRIAASLSTAYQNVLTAKAAYDYQKSNAELTQQTADQSAQQYGLGLASKVDNDTASLGNQQAKLAFQESGYALFQAMEAYDWAVNGLANASASSS